MIAGNGGARSLEKQAKAPGKPFRQLTKLPKRCYTYTVYIYSSVLARLAPGVFENFKGVVYYGILFQLRPADR